MLLLFDSQRRLASEAGLFESLPARRPPWAGLLSSILLHAIGLILLPPYLAQRSADAEAETWLRNAILHAPVRIHVPEPLYMASAARPAPVPVKISRQARRDLRKPARIRISKEGAGQIAGRRFEMPPLPKRLIGSRTLLQPAAPLELPAEARLPDLFFWAPPANLSRPPDRVPFLLPGHAEPFAQVPRLDAPPQLEIPNWEVANAGLNAAARDAQASSPLSPGTSMPIRVAGPQPPAPNPEGHVAIDRSLGDPVSIISLSPEPGRIDESLTVPVGNEIAGGGPAKGRGAQGQGAGDGTPAGDSTSGQEAAVEPAPEGETPAAAAPAGSAPTPEKLLADALASTRLRHPRNGEFDIVVQSTGNEGYPESEGILSGKPVSSVYLHVGARKEWILQYCIPAGEAGAGVAQSGSVVQLETPGTLKAPYPLTTFRPPLQHAGRTVMVHGYIEPSGIFAQLRVLGKRDPAEGRLITSVLDRWEFRPATTGGNAVRVEVLLVIPAE